MMPEVEGEVLLVERQSTFRCTAAIVEDNLQHFLVRPEVEVNVDLSFELAAAVRAQDRL